MTRKSALIAALVLIGGSTAALAKVTDTDRSFLVQETQGARYEIAIAKLAATKAATPAIKAYAKKIVADHAQANPALMQLAKSKDVTIPAGMSTSDTAKLTTLKEAKGKAFDTAYVDEVTRVNSQDEDSFKKETGATQDAQIKAYVAKFSKMDAAHKKMGEALKAS